MKALLLLALMLVPLSQARAVEVLATIKPLQLIASAITEGVTETQLLLPPGSSPHDYALRPSDVRKIKRADLVLWVGPELERFLAPVLEKKANSLMLLPLMSEEHNEHEHEHKHHKVAIENHEDHHDHPHDHGTQDVHIWLDPHQAEQIAQLLADRLTTLDPDNSSRYQRNLQQFQTTLTAVDQRITRQLAPARGIGYFVFHDAYSYWEQHYQLPALGHFTVNPARAPGAKTVAEIHQALKQAKAKCVFAEPQFKPAVVSAVLRNTEAKLGSLDPLATDIAPGPQSYFVFIQQLADDMTDCLLNKP